MRTVQDEFSVWTIQNAPDELKERIFDKHRFCLVEDSHWFDFDGLFGLSKEEMTKRKIKLEDCPADIVTYKAKYFDIEGPWHLQLDTPVVPNEEVFRKFLRVPKRLWYKTWWEFYDDFARYPDTKLKFHEYDSITEKEWEVLHRAEEIWYGKLQDALSILQRQFEYSISNEALTEFFEMNEFEFKEDGSLF